MTAIRYQILRTLLLIVLVSVSSQAQEKRSTGNEPPSTSYGFVSANAQENLTLSQAVRKLRSPEQASLVSATHQVGCRARFKPLVMSAIGSWSDGAENSTLFKTSTDTATIRYAIASLGRRARQKAVLYFRETRDGKARLYIFDSARRNLFALSRLLDRAGVAFRTLVPLKTRTLVYIVDLKDELREEIPAAARLLRAQVRTLRGHADFIGDDEDRQKAQSIFETEMSAFESTHANPSSMCRMQ